MGDASPNKPTDRDLQPDIEVLEPNWNTVQVYVNCSWIRDVLTGTKVVVVYVDISAQEVMAAATLLNIPSDEWAKIVRNINCHMIPAAKKVLNQR